MVVTNVPGQVVQNQLKDWEDRILRSISITEYEISDTKDNLIRLMNHRNRKLEELVEIRSALQKF